MGIVEKNMETTMMGDIGFRVWGSGSRVLGFRQGFRVKGSTSNKEGVSLVGVVLVLRNTASRIYEGHPSFWRHPCVETRKSSGSSSRRTTVSSSSSLSRSSPHRRPRLVVVLVVVIVVVVVVVVVVVEEVVAVVGAVVGNLRKVFLP